MALLAASKCAAAAKLLLLSEREQRTGGTGLQRPRADGRLPEALRCP
jgi:hypothetical protein